MATSNDILRALGRIEGELIAINQGLPYDVIRGYDESLYPEYMEKLKTMKPATAPK